MTPTLDWFCTACRLRHREPVPAAPVERSCRECAAANRLGGAELGAVGAAGRPTLGKCPHCGAPDLWDKRDFPERLGWGLVVFGLLGSIGLIVGGHPFYAFAFMGSFVFLDVAAYWLTPPMSACYGCMAELRGIAPDHGPFDIHRAEEYAHSLADLGDGPPAGRDEG